MRLETLIGVNVESDDQCVRSIGFTLMGLFLAIASLGQGVTDIDNNFYDTLRIGTQTWFSKNLTTTRFNDGTPIQYTSSQIEWGALTSPSFCWYNNNVASKDIYGALYNGYAVKTGKLCPSGWHVPTSPEWSTLVNFLGGNTTAGGKLKETGTALWQSPNNGATNEVGFSARPGGYRPADNFYALGLFGFWWTSTEYESNYAWSESIRNDEIGMMGTAGRDFGSGLSVRCVKDLPIPCQPTEGNYVVSACNSYVWIDGKTYTSSNNTATFKLKNKAGCDSLVRLHLTIKLSTSSIHQVKACDSFTWIDGKTYTSSNNTATFKLANKAGCDSLVYLNLTMNSAQVTLAVSGTKISSGLTGDSYMWFNCDTGKPIENAVNQSFEPVASGSYRVEVMHQGCKKVSSCLVFLVTATEENLRRELLVYPNPVTEFLRISSSSGEHKIITIFDARGAEVLQINTSDEQPELDTKKLSPGVYFIKVQTPKETAVSKFFKIEN